MKNRYMGLVGPALLILSNRPNLFTCGFLSKIILHATMSKFLAAYHRFGSINVSDMPLDHWGKGQNRVVLLENKRKRNVVVGTILLDTPSTTTQFASSPDTIHTYIHTYIERERVALRRTAP